MASLPSAISISIASDHAGVDLKSFLIKQTPRLQHPIAKNSQTPTFTEIHWNDLGPHDARRVDYPDFAAAVAKSVASGKSNLGVLICGSGIGMSITANKWPGLRAAAVENPVAARLAREHNDANVLCLGARFLAPAYAQEILLSWLMAEYDAQSRHQQRLDKICQLEAQLRSEKK